MSELIVIEKQNALQLFTEGAKLDPLLDRVFAEVRAFVPDTSTATGRKNIASMAYKVAQSKVYLDNAGKALVDDLKKLPKTIDAERKRVRDKLEELQKEVRQPLDEWEAEQARIEAEAMEAAEAAKLAAEIDHCHELALLMNAEHDRAKEQARIDAERAAAEAERLRAEAEAKRIADAAEAARIAAEAKAAAEIAAAEQARRDAEIRAEANAMAAKQAAEKAEADRIAAAAKAERDRIDAEAKAERDKLAAIEAERLRVAAEAKRIADDTAKREADTKHRARINNEVLADLMAGSDISADQAKAIIKAIVSGKVRNVTISY